MKKFTIFAFSALLLMSFSLPVSALENDFGGYWRTRMFSYRDISGNDTESMDFTAVQTRTNLYYTAILNDNVKFVNKFEMNAYWGDEGYGDIGADGVEVKVKNTYLDFTVEPVNVKLGVQGATLARGFIFDDDFAGVTATMNSETISIPFIWMKAYEGNNEGPGRNARDVDYYIVAPTFKVSETFTVNPYVLYAMSDNAQDWGPLEAYEDVSIYFVGLDLDLDMDMFSFWFTGIYEGGSADLASDNSKSHDFASYLGALGGSAQISDMFGVHFQGFYASGDDDKADDDFEQFYVPCGQSHYWAELMGYGIIDETVSNNSPADQIGDIMAANAGIKLSPREDLSLTFDLWYAALAEDDENGENYLGTEFDAVLSYKLLENIDIDVVGAYLLAGDATTGGVDNDADPYEIGAQFSISF